MNQPHGTQPTMEDVATRAGVSRALVSLVMRDAPNVSDARRAAVLEAAADLGYRPNLNARNLAQRRTMTIGVLINDIHNPFFADVIDGVEIEAERHGLDVIILNGGRDPDREANAIDTFRQFRAEGLVLIGSRLGDEQLLDAAGHVPSVVVAAGRDHVGMDSVTTDDEAGARLAIDHLVELGHTRIVHLDGAANISSAPRRSGYERAMEAHGLDPMIIEAGDSDGDAERAVDRIEALGTLPTALFCFNDLLAAGVLDALGERGLEVPGDVSTIGYDNTFISSLHSVSLTTIDQPRLEMGRLAVELMSQRIDGERTDAVRRTLDPALIVRGSTARR